MALLKEDGSLDIERYNNLHLKNGQKNLQLSQMNKLMSTFLNCP